MISVEGDKAFHVDLMIIPKNSEFKPFYIKDKDWLYKPDTNCWYGNGQSFPAEICEVISIKV